MVVNLERSTWPIMVRIGLWGVPTRRGAWIFFWLSIAGALGGGVVGFLHPIGFLALILLFSALWYYLCIRWVDQHGGW